MTGHPRAIPIWFFIGSLLLIYGILVLIAGVDSYFNPEHNRVVLAEYNASIWWGIILIVLGAYYVIRFRPKTAEEGTKGLTGSHDQED